MNTLGGFLESQQCILVGDFNVDFDRGGALGKLLLVDFQSELNLCTGDMSFHSSVSYTYEKEDGSARSWIDHNVCSQSYSSLVTNVHTIILPLTHKSTPFPSSSCSSSSGSLHIDWSKASACDIDNYRSEISQHLSMLTSEITITNAPPQNVPVTMRLSMIMLKILSLPCLYVLTNASPLIHTLCGSCPYCM